NVTGVQTCALPISGNRTEVTPSSSSFFLHRPAQRAPPVIGAGGVAPALGSLRQAGLRHAERARRSACDRGPPHGRPRRSFDPDATPREKGSLLAANPRCAPKPRAGPHPLDAFRDGGWGRSLWSRESPGLPP